MASIFPSLRGGYPPYTSIREAPDRHDLIRQADPPRVDRGTDIVTVFVGLGKDKFTVHKNLICASSQFFKRAFEGGFTEGVSQELTLPEEKPCLFEFFCSWLYMSKYNGADWSQLQMTTKYGEGARWVLLYRMGDRLMIPGLRLLALRQFTKMLSSTQPTVPTEEIMTIIYEPDASKMFRNYIIKHVAYWLSKTGSATWTCHYESMKEFGIDMALELASNHLPGHNMRHASHPGMEFVGFAKSHGLDISELREEARAADDKTLTKGSTLTGMFPASQEY